MLPPLAVLCLFAPPHLQLGKNPAESPRLLLNAQMGQAVRYVGFANGGRAVVGIDSGGSVREFDISSGAIRNKLELGERTQAAIYDQEGSVAIRHPIVDQRVRPEVTVASRSRPVQSRALAGRAFLPQYGGLLFDIEGGRTVLQVARTGQLYGTPWPIDIDAVAISAAGDLAVAKVGKELQVLSLTGRRLARLPWYAGVHALAIAAVEPWAVATTSSTVFVWNYRTGQARRFTPPDVSFSSASAIRYDGRFAVIGGVHGRAYLIDLQTGRVAFVAGSREMGSVYAVQAVAFDGSGDRIAVGFATGELKVWEVSPVTGAHRG